MANTNSDHCRNRASLTSLRSGRATVAVTASMKSTAPSISFIHVDSCCLVLCAAIFSKGKRALLVLGAASPLHMDPNNNPERPWAYPSTQADIGPNEEFPEEGTVD